MMRRIAAAVAACVVWTAFPSARSDWPAVESPEAAGFSSKRLDALRTWLQSLDTTAMMVIAGHRVLFSYGDVTHVSYLASGRKSVLALLYGRYVEDGTIALNRTIADAGLDDVGGLMPRERQATIEQLLTARSGVYHAPSNGGDDTAHAPPRGSIEPGSRFLYNNWDFNAAGAAFEKLTGRDIYDALESDLAEPLEMQDFDRSRQRKSGNLGVSAFAAYHVFLSTRDMARIGLLALRGGRWNERQVIPTAWIRKITSLRTPFAEMNQAFEDSPPTADRWGYGYLWWVYDALSGSDPLAGAATAWGVGGQYITVLPKLDIVIAHKVDTEGRRAVTARQYDAVLRMVVEARQPR